MGLLSFNAMAQNQTSGFVANAWQMKATDGTLRSDLLFSTQVQGAKVFLAKTGINYVWYRSAVDTTLEKDSTYRMEVEFKNANPNVLVQSSDVQASYSNYFVGNVSAANVAEYGKVIYKSLWPNIDLELTSDKSGLSYRYVLAKGANPNDIQLVYNGGKKFSNKSKVLDIDVAFGKKLKVSSLKITQLSGNKTEAITSGTKTGAVVTINTSVTNKNLIKAITANYNSSESYEITQYVANSTGPTLSPFVNNSWTTYFGGSDRDQVTDVFTSANDTLWVTGVTNSGDFPVVFGNVQIPAQSLGDIFISKFAPNREHLFTTFIGGNGRDRSTQIAVNSKGEIYIAGYAGSYTSGTYTQYFTNPLSYQSNQTSQPLSEGIVSKFNSSGVIIWSTNFGGENSDGIAGLSIASNDNVFIAGGTNSTSLPVKTLAGAFNQSYSNCGDVGDKSNGFVAMFDPNDVLQWCSYYGGSLEDGIFSCTIDDNNNFFIYGSTTSNGNVGTCGVFSVPMPVCTPAGSYLQVNNKGNGDLFITKFDQSGIIAWATLYGGNGVDFPGYYNAITTDRNGDVYITGNTDGNFNLKIKSNAYNQPAYGGGKRDAFIVKFNTNGVHQWGTYLGGKDTEFANAIQAGGNFGVLIGGQTLSSNFPVFQQPSLYYQGVQNNNGLNDITDGFLTILNNDDNFYMSTYIGGFDYDVVQSIATANKNNNIFLGGLTQSIDFPVFDPVGSLDYFNGDLNLLNNATSSDGFIMNLAIPCNFCEKNERESYTRSNSNLNVIYPNPVDKNGSITIKSTEIITELKVYDGLGKLMNTNKTIPGNSIILNLADFSPGIYWVSIFTLDGIQTEKLIIY